MSAAAGAAIANSPRESHPRDTGSHTLVEFLAAAAEDEGRHRLEAYHHSAGAGMFDQHGVDALCSVRRPPGIFDTSMICAVGATSCRAPTGASRSRDDDIGPAPGPRGRRRSAGRDRRDRLRRARPRPAPGTAGVASHARHHRRRCRTGREPSPARRPRGPSRRRRCTPDQVSHAIQVGLAGTHRCRPRRSVCGPARSAKMQGAAATR